MRTANCVSHMKTKLEHETTKRTSSPQPARCPPSLCLTTKQDGLRFPRPRDSEHVCHPDSGGKQGAGDGVTAEKALSGRNGSCVCAVPCWPLRATETGSSSPAGQAARKG